MTIGDAVDTLLGALGLGDDSAPDLGWENRLKEAAYTSPSGDRMRFDYEDLSCRIIKKTTGFNFPDADGTYVQDHGLAGRQYPMRVIFWGKDCDLIARGFEILLEEKGPGKLEHPIHGIKNVVPFGTITRRDDLKTAANQVIFDVVFWDTIGIAYPESQSDPESDANAALDAFQLAQMAQIDQQVSLSTPLEEASFINQMQSSMQDVTNVLTAIAEVQQAVLDEFNEYAELAGSALDNVGNILAIAQNVQNMIAAPSNAADSLAAQMDAYNNLAQNIFGSNDAISVPTTGPNAAGTDRSDSNKFFARDLFACSYVTSSARSTINNEFKTRSAALAAAEQLETQLGVAMEWREANYKSLGSATVPSNAGADMGDAYALLRQSISATMGYLVATSLRLKQERAVVLGRPRSMIDVCGELYGAVDSQLDFFILSNDLTGSEILELPKGRRIVYYV